MSSVGFDILQLLNNLTLLFNLNKIIQITRDQYILQAIVMPSCLESLLWRDNGSQFGGSIKYEIHTRRLNLVLEIGVG